MGFGNNLGPAVDYSHNILQIVAHPEIVLAAPMKCFELCGEKVRSGNDSDFILADSGSQCMFQSWPIPAIAEAQDGRVGWHKIKNEIPVLPAANWSAFDVGLVKAKIAETILKDRELRVGRDRDDCINIESRPHRSGSGIGDE